MKKVILLRYGEIHLKGKNRGYFERVLLNNLQKTLSGLNCVVVRTAGRYLITDIAEGDFDKVYEKASKVFGFVSISTAYEVDTNYEIIEKSCLEYVLKLSETENFDKKTFKVKTTRADKNFPYHSDKFSAHIGEIILEKYPILKVKLVQPNFELEVDIRESGKTYIFCGKDKCVGGMPVGTAGHGLVMLSGGIDSPVSAYLMAKRGLSINAIHFHSFPYTSLQAKEKVISLAKILTEYSGKIKMFIVPFTRIQEAIHANCDESYMITIMRRIMLRIAEKICEKHNFKSIITGESLGQVASQTVESITVTNDVLKQVPVLRPLIAMDKVEIIEIAKRIGTFNTSILPYEDCCTVFLPENPVIKPSIRKATQQEKFLNIDELIEQAISGTEVLIV